MIRAIRHLTVTLAAFAALAFCAEGRADSKQECAAAYEKTQSLRDEAKLIDARKQAVACSASTCSEYVIKDCMQWLADIDAMLPTVVFTAVDTTGAETTAVRVIVDGQVLAEKLDGKSVPMDPGEHLVRFEMGTEALEQKVLIRQGEKNRTLPASFKKALPIEQTAAKLPPPPPPPPPPPSASGGFWNPYRIGAVAAGIVGLAGIGIGVGFGAMTFSQWDQALDYCNNRDIENCTDQGITLGKEAGTSATISDTGFIVGGVGLAAATLLLILSPKDGPAGKGKAGVRVIPVVGQHGLGTLVGGNF